MTTTPAVTHQPGATCAIVQAITEIYGSGIYADEDDPAYCVKVGRGETECVLDEVVYYIMMTRLEFARADMQQDLSRLQHIIAGWRMETPHACYKAIIDATLGKSRRARQHLMQLHELAKSTERYLSLYISRVARTTADPSINVTLPGQLTSPDGDLEADPAALHRAAGAFITYINTLNINSLLRTRYPPVPPLLAPPQVALPATVRANATTLDEARAALADHLAVANVAAAVERYHCAVIVHLRAIYDVYQKITEQIAASMA